jgi:micrococcal nuclease
VSQVVDGDTIEIFPAIDGIEEVRLIGVDTPETNDPYEGVEPYGLEATGFATDELTGRRVGLEFDVERVDQYDRLLAYVYAGGEMFNEDLVEEGYAQTYPYPPNTKYADRFEEAQEGARAGGLGIWGLSLDQQCQLANHGNGIGEGSAGCEVVTDPSATATATATSTATAGGAAGGAVPPISEENCPPNAPIKGNESSSGELIYHMPNDAYYDATHPEECFATPQDAEAAGYRAAEV